MSRKVAGRLARVCAQLAVNEIMSKMLMPRAVEPTHGVRYISSSQPAEGSHNGSAAVLKTAVRKDMQVRVLSPPPFLHQPQKLVIQSHQIFGQAQHTLRLRTVL